MLQDWGDPNKPTLGIHVGPTGSKRDTLGLFVTYVVPDGPAEKAGIVEGDRIASINGLELRLAPQDLDDEFAGTISSHRLSRAMKKIEVGNKVNLRVYSGGRYKEVQVTSARSADVYKNENHKVSGMWEGFGENGAVFAVPHVREFNRDGDDEDFEVETPRIRVRAPGEARIISPDRIREMRIRTERLSPEIRMRIDQRLNRLEPEIRMRLDEKMNRLDRDLRERSRDEIREEMLRNDIRELKEKELQGEILEGAGAGKIEGLNSRMDRELLRNKLRASTVEGIGVGVGSGIGGGVRAGTIQGINEKLNKELLQLDRTVGSFPRLNAKMNKLEMDMRLNELRAERMRVAPKPMRLRREIQI